MVQHQGHKRSPGGALRVPQRRARLHAVCRAAVRVSAGLEAAPITPGECLHVLETIFAFYEAARTGKVQDV